MGNIHANVDVLGVRVDLASREDMLKSILQFCHSEAHSRVSTVNPELIMIANGNHEFKHALNSAQLNTIDGIGLQWAVGMKSRGGPCERYTGVDIMEDLVAASAALNFRIGLLGGRTGAAHQARERLIHRYPGADVWCAPFLTVGDDLFTEDLVLDQIRAAGVACLLVAFGSPKGELWLSRHIGATGAKVGIGVGGSFEMHAGILPRAPTQLRNLGLEWLYRWFLEPRRITRIARLPKFALKVLLEDCHSPR